MRINFAHIDVYLPISSYLDNGQILRSRIVNATVERLKLLFFFFPLMGGEPDDQ